GRLPPAHAGLTLERPLPSIAWPLCWPGSGEVLRPPRPLGTARDTRASYGRAFRSAFRKTRPRPSVLLAIVNLPVTMLVQQLQIVHRVLASMTAPTPMMNVPRFLAGSQRLATTRTAPFLPPP